MRMIVEVLLDEDGTSDLAMCLVDQDGDVWVQAVDCPVSCPEEAGETDCGYYTFQGCSVCDDEEVYYRLSAVIDKLKQVDPRRALLWKTTLDRHLPPSVVAAFVESQRRQSEDAVYHCDLWTAWGSEPHPVPRHKYDELQRCKKCDREYCSGCIQTHAEKCDGGPAVSKAEYDFTAELRRIE